MRFASKALAAVSLTLIIAASSFGQAVSGAWKGHLEADFSKVPKAQNAEQQKQMDSMIAMLKAMKFNLTLNKNKTFKLIVPASGMMKKGKVVEGTWKQTGNKVSLLATKDDGKKPVGKNEPQTMVLSKDGKTLTLNAGNGGPGMGQVVFVR